MKKITPKKQFLLAFIGFLVISLLVQNKFITSFPHHIHAWAHCDHYALSKGFIDNGFDFTKPQTFVYNKQFPNDDETERKDKITSVDFPINNYLVAISMKVLGTEAPWVFRLYMLLVSCIGLSFLYLITCYFSSNYLVNFFCVILICFTPIYLDYQVGFLPSAAAISIFFGAAYFVTKFLSENNIKHLVFACLLLSLATLIRTPFVIFLIALCGVFFLDSLASKKIKIKQWLIAIAAFIPPILYFWYNTQLRSEHGSLFLNRPLILESWEHFKYILSTAIELWGDDYFNAIQVIILIIVLVYIIVNSLLIKPKVSSETKKIIHWIWISLSGVLIYTSLMFPQFSHHDYYVIDTWYPVIIIVLILIYSKFEFSSTPRTLIILFGGLTIASVLISSDTLQERRSYNEVSFYFDMYGNYSHSEDLLRNNGVKKEEKILIIDAMAPNMGFLLNDYSGDGLIYRDSASIVKALSWDNQHILVSMNYFLKHLVHDYPPILYETKLLDRKEGLLLLKKQQDSAQNKDLLSYFNIKQANPKMTFTSWKNLGDVELSDDQNHGVLRIDNEYTVTYQDTIHPDNKLNLITLSIDIKASSLSNEVFWSTVLESDDIQYENNYIHIEESTEFKTYERTIFVPYSENEVKLSSYLYNPNGQKLLYKNLVIKYY